jgi:phosphatidylglycerophosphate synthase
VIDNVVRQVLPRFVSPLLAVYRRLGWTPNHVTLLGFGLALVASLAVAAERPTLGLVLWWISRLADGTDGIYARATDQESDFGGYLDIVLDMAAYGAMVLGFAIARPEFQAQWMAMLFLYVLCIASALALGAMEAKLERPPRDERGLRLGAGLAEGGETGIAYTIFLLFPQALVYSVNAWVAILLWTVLARTALAHRSLREPPSPDAPKGP